MMETQGKGKLVQINTVCNTSTGKIMKDIQREAVRQGYEAISFVGRRKPFQDLRCEKIGNPISFWIHVVINTLFDRQGHGSCFMTRKLVKRLRQEKPDIIHLHNLHGYYLNIPLLCNYLSKEFQGKLYWTFHDCWPFTGHCAYFTMAGCEKWKYGCSHCPNKKSYPVSLLLDASAVNYREKKQLFGKLDNLTILTPSEWLKELAEQSFFHGRRIRVIPNGIDLQTFAYRSEPAILAKYQIPEDKKLLLGVANIWEKRKGLQDLIELSQKLSEDYRIVVVGASKKQIRKMPGNMVGIEKTEEKEELAVIYSAAEIFINPSLEETFSLVTAEAIACGTPVIVLDTSAVKELVTSENGIVLHRHETEDYLDAIRRLEEKGVNRQQVAESAACYNSQKTARQIVKLYEE